MHDILKQARDRIAKAAAGGKSLEEVIAAKPTAEWDDELAKGPLKSEMFVMTVYRSLPTAKKSGKSR